LTTKPFLKWVGGKRRLLPQILPYVPSDFRTYHEPFLGGGALFFHLQPSSAFLSDSNGRLVRTYEALRADVDAVIAQLGNYPHNKEFYYTLRGWDVGRGVSDVDVASWFIYLNKTGFNGLYRVNKHGGFNVPFGHYSNPQICDEKSLLACSEVLSKPGVHITSDDFEAVLERAEQGDFVYFDPPYVPLSVSSSFVGYTQDGFGFEDQLRLRDVAVELKRREVKVLLSNSNHPLVRELYSDHFALTEVFAARSINSDGSGRGKIKELLIHGDPS
jgi:DNA adenine methylase